MPDHPPAYLLTHFFVVGPDSTSTLPAINLDRQQAISIKTSTYVKLEKSRLLKFMNGVFP